MYDLPEELLRKLEPIQEDAIPQEDEAAVLPQESSKPKTTDAASGTGTSCTLCGVQFENVQEQRKHVKSDFHGYNLKQKIKGLRPVKEQEFEILVGGGHRGLSFVLHED